MFGWMNRRSPRTIPDSFMGRRMKRGDAVILGCGVISVPIRESMACNHDRSSHSAAGASWLKLHDKRPARLIVGSISSTLYHTLYSSVWTRAFRLHSHWLRNPVSSTREDRDSREPTTLPLLMLMLLLRY